jgi:hypothetical protein
MARDLTASVQAAIDAAEVKPFLLFEGNFSSGTVRMWSGYGDLSWNGFTWVGAGNLAAVSPVNENDEIRANGITVSLSGIPSEMISLVLNEVGQGRLGRLYIGFLDASDAIIADPILSFEGRLDVPALEDNGETAMITITYESRLIDLQRARESRYTNEEQKRLYPGDVGFEFVPYLQDVVLNWGRAEADQLAPYFKALMSLGGKVR